jgi:uncharacterized membrane protein (UPF0182 family)
MRARQRRRRAAVRWLAARRAGAVCYDRVGIVGWYVSSFIVKPNELVRERPYIANNIEMTRQAYGSIASRSSRSRPRAASRRVDAANNQATLQNIRLWDWRALQDTLRQIQEIRTYYDFPTSTSTATRSTAVRQMMLAARELNVERCPRAAATGSTRS